MTPIERLFQTLQDDLHALMALLRQAEAAQEEPSDASK